MYSKANFGYDLKKHIIKKKSTDEIGCWIYTVYLDWPDVNDVPFLNLLTHLATMELGPEFTFTYEELDKIADDLIAGKEVNL